MKRLAYLKSEAADCILTFEESVKEIEDKIGNKKKSPTTQPVVNEEISCSPEKSESRDVVKTFPEKSEQPRPGREVKSHENDEEGKRDGESEADVQYRKLWRAIARMTHPDVSGDNDNNVALYKAAAEAHEKKKRGELLDVASEIGIVLPDPHDMLIEDAHKRCEHYENLIIKVRGSVAWQWKNSSESTQKEIIDLILKTRAEKQSDKQDQ